jgi:hypothetical protein
MKNSNVSLGKGLDFYSENKKRVVDARSFVNILNYRKEQVKTTKFIPPKLGKKDFGKFIVEFK